MRSTGHIYLTDLVQILCGDLHWDSLDAYCFGWWCPHCSVFFRVKGHYAGPGDIFALRGNIDF